MKTFLLVLIFILVGAFTIKMAYAAPILNYSRTVIPETDSLYDLGTTTRAWREGWFDGVGLTGLTAGSALFAGASGLISQDNANLSYNDTSNYLTANQLRIPKATSATVGGIYFDSTRYLHSFGTNNTFLGLGSGNQTLTSAARNVCAGDGCLISLTTGTNNTGLGQGSLGLVSSGSNNFGLGRASMPLLTTGSSNIAIGFQALQTATSSSQLIAIGESTLSNVQSGSSEHTAIGYFAGNAITNAARDTLLGYQAGNTLTTGYDNVFVGARAGKNATSTFENTAVGALTAQALTYNGTLGYGNSFFGYNSGSANTTGTFNTWVGHSAGDTLTTGGSNTGVGRAALTNMLTGGWNVALGHASCFYNTAGNANLCLGNSAGSNPLTLGSGNTTGSYTIAIGEYAGFNTNLTNSTAIGNYTLASTDNVMVLGSASTSWLTNVGIATSSPAAKFSIQGNPGGTMPLMLVSSSTAGFATSTAFMIDSQGKVGVGTSTPWRTLSVTGTVGLDGLGASGAGDTYVCISSNKELLTGATCAASTRSIKENIAGLDSAVDMLSRLEPVSFKYKDGYYGGINALGFIAEDVAEIDPRLVILDVKGNVQNVEERGILAVVVKVVQELVTRSDEQEERIMELEARIAELESRQQ